MYEPVVAYFVDFLEKKNTKETTCMPVLNVDCQSLFSWVINHLNLFVLLKS